MGKGGKGKAYDRQEYVPVNGTKGKDSGKKGGKGKGGKGGKAAAKGSMSPFSSELTFAVDGEVHRISPDPSLTLSDWLRSNRHTSVKIGCGEGGCGACMVTTATWNEAEQKVTYRSVNSCLMPLASCHGVSVTTSAGLGNNDKGFHPIQTALAENNASQCGFCTPGMVMSIFGLLSSTKGDDGPSEANLEHCLDGNLCRCTGYRPILAAAKSFAGCKKDFVGEACAPYPEALKAALKEEAHNTLLKFSGSGKTWLSPPTLDDLFKYLTRKTPRSVSLVAGHTCRGIYKDDHKIDVLIDVSRVPELTAISKADGKLAFGGAVTWGTFIESMEDVVATTPGAAALPPVIEHARKVAGPGIRNLGTLGGNLVMTKLRGFQSDLATCLAGIGATVTVMKSKAEKKTMPVDEFFSGEYALPEHAVVTSISVPFLESSAEATSIVKSFRTAIRPVNAHALLNATFSVSMKGKEMSKVRLVFGALGSRGSAPGPSSPETGEGASGGPVRALAAERAMVGQTVGQTALHAAMAALASEAWWPEDDFERHLAQSYLYKLFHAMAGTETKDAPPQSVSLATERPATTGTQVVTWATPDMAPIAAPMPKLSSKLQAAGRQSYTNDLPEPQGCLYAAYVTIPRANAVFVGYDIEPAQKMPGFFGVIDASDIQAQNVCELIQVQKIFVPKGSPSQFAGQPCLLLLADSTKHAEAAAKVVKVSLELPRDPPILTIEACRAKQKEADEGKQKLDSPLVAPSKEIKRGDPEAAFRAAPCRVSGEAFCDGQKAFYMEPPASLVVPGEDNTLNVWGTFQVPSWAHDMVSKCTGLPKHKVVMNVTHIGGGFGSKLTKSLHVVCAASVAALKFQRPVRLHLNRNVDTVMCAGRLPMSFEYEVGFERSGKLLAVRMKDFADQGSGDGCAGFAIMIAVQNMEQIYAIPNLHLEGFLCTTHKSGNTAVRGPGEPQAAFIMETIIDHVAAELGKSPQEIREANIFVSKDAMLQVTKNPKSPDTDQHCAMFAMGEDCAKRKFKGFPAGGIWTMLKQKASFDEKAAAVEKFNKEHRWRKRAVAMTPVKYHVDVRAQQALVCLYTDGTCLITCDGTEIGQGLHTKIIQYASYHLSQIVPGCEVPLQDIRVGPNGTDKVAHGSITGGSTTSEGVCEAVRDAIGKLKENMQPALEKLKEKGKEITFKSLVGAAGDSAELQASGKNHNQFGYHVFGACASEVEVDVLTGETIIRSSSIIYDCGKSLNPTVDLGQCEGAFMMGVGFYLRERLVTDPQTGYLATDGTWEYKIPCNQDVPLKFDVEFFPRSFSEAGILSSKCSGEPPLVLASSVFAAVKEAVRAGRKEFGHGEGYFRLDAPATPRDIALAIGAVSSTMKL